MGPENVSRKVGGALGVAILGSIMSSAYASSLATATGGLSAQVAAAARSSLGAALRARAQIGGPAGEALVTAAKTSFTHAMDRGLVVGAAVTLLGALVSLIWLPARAQPVPVGEGPPRAIDEDPTAPAEETQRAGAMKA